LSAWKLNDLPYSRMEEDTILSLWEGSKTVISDSVTEADLMQGLKSSGALHVSSHALNRLEGGSSLVLCPSATDDGFFEASDLKGRLCQSRLVFLSSCGSSGVMPRGAGSYVATLPQAFLDAGCKAVIASRWEVNDREAAEVSSLFYRNLRNSGGVIESLRQAKVEMIRRGYPFRIWALMGLWTAN